jgi:asparagine synthetase B (glutamine-hydrolysing)
MDDSDSTISYDSNGVCCYCNNYKEKILPGWNTGDQGFNELKKHAAKIKLDGASRDFDCIIGLSGGLDSSYCAYVAKEIMGLRPMLFHVDAG